MRRVLYIITCVIGLTISLLLLVICINSDNPRIRDISELMGLSSKNLLSNANFNEGFKNWNHDQNVFIIKTNSVNCILIEGDLKRQLKLWQSINVISGQTYKLTFNLTGPDKGAFAVYNDHKKAKDINIYCNGKNIQKHYCLTFVSSSTGKSKIYLSTKGKGKYYFTNINLNKTNNNARTIYITIAILISISSFILLVRFNIVFVIIVFLLAFVPILKMSKGNNSEAENRTLANYKPLFNKGKKLNKDYGSDFNNWINDRFWLRNELMKVQNSLEFIFDGKVDNKFVLQGKDKWFFLKGNIRRIARPDSYYENIYEDTKKAVSRFNDFCYKNKAKLYIILAPFGEEVYPEELPNLNISNRVGRFKKYANRLQADTGASFLYTLESLQNTKTSALAQYKTDHHWTQLGAYNAYKELRDVIYHDFNITQAYQEPFNLSEHRYRLGWGETFIRVKNIADSIVGKIYPENAVYLRFITNRDFNFEDNGTRIINKNGVCKKIFLFGDSYTKNIKDFFGYDFYNIKYTIKPLQIYMPNFEKQISDYKPDIVVMIIYSQNFDLIKNWYTEL